MLEKNSNVLDLSSLKCYKKGGKTVNQNSKYRKNDKSKTISVQFWRGKYGEATVILNNLSQLIGALFLCDFNAYFEIRS